ncbi:MAG: hypothetical protein NUV92_04905 [Ignavibacteria bacterium]|nr:hypothetical protein [Ignavibacteria bacterium]MDH7526842.1 hypothetical protein [Ignavibacteria bacterium]
MKRKIFLINLLFTILLFEIIFPVVVKHYNFMTLSRYGIIQQDEFKTKSASTIFNFSEAYDQAFIELLNNKIDLNLNSEKTLETAIKIRLQLLNLAERKDTTILISRYPDKLLKHMISNKSLLCGEIAKLYGYILHLAGFNVRLITISRSIFDAFDRHTTIEIWDEKRQKWVITDPTFNVSFKDNNDFLSSDEIYDLIHSGNFDSIKVIHSNPTRYEIKLDNYYISVFSLFDNVYFIKSIQHLTINELPPLRWLNNDYKIFLLQSNKFPVFGTGIKIQNSIVFFVLFLFPIIIFTLIIYLFILEMNEKLNANILVHTKPVIIRISRKFNK